MGMEQGAYIDGDSGSDFTYGYGGGGDEFAIDYAADYGGAQNYTSDGDLFGAYYDYYMGMGLDPSQAASYAAEDATAGSIEIPTYEQAPLPDISLPSYGLPYIPNYDYWQSPPYIPVFSDLPTPQPPVGSLPQSPATQQPNLPPACPGGYYHPYPIGHPQQNECRPFPPAPTPAPAPPQQRPQQPSSGGGAQAPRPPQQQCPTGQYRDQATGQCKPIPQGQPQQCPTGYYRAPSGQCMPIPRCTTLGTTFDLSRGICVPQGQAVLPAPSEADDLLANLKKLPWWIWLALGGFLLLGRDEDGRTTTVRYRRAS